MDKYNKILCSIIISIGIVIIALTIQTKILTDSFTIKLNAEDASASGTRIFKWKLTFKNGLLKEGDEEYNISTIDTNVRGRCVVGQNKEWSDVNGGQCGISVNVNHYFDIPLTKEGIESKIKTKEFIPDNGRCPINKVCFNIENI